jgi:ferric-dicitrate binding protein FerR (iron transport regulator)
MSKAREIIGNYFQNTYSKSVQKNFAIWLKDERNIEEKDEILQEIWNEIDIASDDSTEISYHKLHSRLSTTDPQRRKIIPLYAKILRIAAMFLLPILSAAITYLYLQTNTDGINNLQLVEYIVPNGETQTITLPDSSKVQLNAGSLLVYPQHFGKTREIYLNGEAYFTIVRNEKSPFIVKTTDMDIEVLGTVFNMSSYIDNDNSSVTLESGKVNVRFKNQKFEPIILLPNEQVSYNRLTHSVSKHTVRCDDVLAWTKGNLIIQSMSIEEIAKIVERKYNLKVYANFTQFQNEKITMKFLDDETITDFMKVLQYLVPDLQYKIEQDKLYIY